MIWTELAAPHPVVELVSALESGTEFFGAETAEGETEGPGRKLRQPGCSKRVSAGHGAAQHIRRQGSHGREGPGGGFLDDGSAFGVYSRLNLYAAAGKAMQLAANKN
jgi:hypothetical protein